MLIAKPLTPLIANRCVGSYNWKKSLKGGFFLHMSFFFSIFAA